MSKKSTLLIGMLLFGTVAAAGCSNKNEPGAAAPGADERKSVASGEPVELFIYSSSGWTQEAFNEKFGDAIRKKFPQHQINYIQSGKGASYQDLITAGQPIDIVWESIAKFAAMLQYNIQYDITSLIKKHNVDTTRIEPTMIEAMRTMSDGKLYALPVVNNTLSLYYNKDIFDKFAVPYPKDGITWDEVFELNKKLSRLDGSTQYAGLGISQGHYFDINPLSLAKVDTKTFKASINNDKWSILFGTYARLSEASGYKDKIQQANGIPGVDNFVKKKDTAMVAALANMHMTQDVSEVNWDVVTYPKFKEAPNANPQPYPTYFGVSGISKHQDAAMEVIKYLVSDEFQESVSRTGSLPVIKSDAVLKAFAKDTKFIDKNVKSALYSTFSPIAIQTIYDGAVSAAYSKNLLNLALGKMDMNTLLRTTEEEANKAIEAMKAK